MLIRPAQASDTGAIGDLADGTGLFPSNLLADMMAPYLDQRCEDLWFVGEDAGSVISFGFCEPERMADGTWNLLALAVHPERQGAGVGASMLADVERSLSTRGGRILLVETMGTPEFARTRAFYRKNHFTEEARIREFYAAGADKVVFWKRLAVPVLSPARAKS